jgi:DHA1 family multidrug resistance protein-like MFS transporter
MSASAPGAPIELSPLLRRQGLLVLLTNNLLMWTGFIMVVPLLAVHYVDGLGWPAAAIGIVLGVRQFTQQGLGVFGGIVADRIGVKGLIMAGLLLRAVGFGMMAWANNFTILLISAIFAALGGALFEAPGRSAVVQLSLPEERGRYFAIQSTTSSIGTAIGPLLGTLLLRYSFDLVALTAGSFYIVACISTFFWLPIQDQVGQGEQNLFSGLQWALQDKLFMVFTGLASGMWFMWVQFSVALPLQATALTGTADAVSWTYMINAVLSITLQYPLVRFLSRWLKPVPMLGLGMILMACGLGAVAIVHTTPLLLAAVALYVCGSLLAMPSQQTASAELANPLALGSYFGVGALSLAVGGGVGNLAGGYLYDMGQTMAWPSLPWIVFWVVGVLTGGGLFWLHRQLAERYATGNATAPTTAPTTATTSAEQQEKSV